MNQEICPCGLQSSFIDCCGRYINGNTPAPTPEALMRSRYSAYTTANIDYIQKTMRGPASKNFDPIDTQQWAESVDWLGLEVIKSSKVKHKKGYVEFIATYFVNHHQQKIHERSEFHFVNNCWYYVNGETPS